MSREVIALGIDTSNYTTSAALVLNGIVISNRKLPLPVADGQRGLRQSDAVFAHTKNLPDIMDAIAGDLCGRTPTAVGCSVSPRDAAGSYMPCFLAGRAAAHAAGTACGAQIFEFSHQAGHIAAALYSAGALGLLDGGEPFAAFHVSGGTTDVCIVTPGGREPKIERVGGTTDLNAGQLIDRVGVMMGERFPCGAALEAMAEGAEFNAGLKISVNGLYCSLSGGENKARQQYESGMGGAAVASYTLDFVSTTLDALTGNLRQRYGMIPVIYAGGVMSCRRMRSLLGRRENVFFAEPEFSADNAAGTALLAYKNYTEAL